MQGHTLDNYRRKNTKPKPMEKTLNTKTRQAIAKHQEVRAKEITLDEDQDQEQLSYPTKVSR